MASLGTILAIQTFRIAYNYAATGKISNTEMNVRVARRCIEWFKDLEGYYPRNFSEIKRSIIKHNIDVDTVGYDQYLGLYMHLNGIFDETMTIGVFSSALGKTQVYSELNGKGGWYYDSTTGQVKVNLLQPVKHYMKFYNGPQRDDIPADW